MIDNLIISRSNWYGLTRDVEILRSAIEAVGGYCEHVAPRSRPLIDRLLRRGIARHAFHVERAFPQWFSAAEKHFLIPNQERFPKRHLHRLRKIDRVLAKTRSAEAVFAALHVPTAYVGFTSLDRRNVGVSKDNRLLHIAGGSTLKGTEDILALWGQRQDWPQLVLVQKKENAPARIPTNVTLHAGFLEESALTQLMNACRIHICPSRSEGWGHSIVEAMSCSAVVITTDAPPMNELVSADYGLLVPVACHEPRHLGISYYVDRSALEQAIGSAIALSTSELQRRGTVARQVYERQRDAFAARIESFVAR